MLTIWREMRSGCALAAMMLLAQPRGLAYADTLPMDAASTAPPLVGEVTVLGRRSPLPDLQERQDFHRAELEELRKRFEPPGKPETRRERVLSLPNPDKGKSTIPSPASSIDRGAPTNH